MAADRGAFIDQSQSLNIHIAEPNYGKLTSMHFYGWKQVRETGRMNLNRRMKNENYCKFNNVKNSLLPLATGSEDRNVLSEDKACCQPHPVHPEQGEAEGGAGAGQGFRGGGQRA